MPLVRPCLWFDDRIEEAVKFYIATFKDGEIKQVSHRPDGRVLTMTFRLRDQTFMGLNGGPHFKFNEAVSFFVDVKTQDEFDYFWNTLTADGGEESMCGWLKDKYGLSWQIVPDQLIAATTNPDKAIQKRAMDAMMKMRRIDITAIERAVAG